MCLCNKILCEKPFFFSCQLICRCYFKFRPPLLISCDVRSLSIIAFSSGGFMRRLEMMLLGLGLTRSYSRCHYYIYLQRWEFIKENKKVRKQEKMKKRTRPRKRSRKNENKEENKNSTKKTRKRPRKKEKNFLFS